MNETNKTAVFWGVACLAMVLAAFVAWPSTMEDSGGVEGSSGLGGALFPEFKDPLVAASLKIVTFDEVQGELKNFEVRKDTKSGVWTIPSKSGYPADAIEQMRDAANALVGLDILDVPTDNPEDHAGMGVVEPKLEDLDPGDEGVGRLVTFKDGSQKVLASVIIGNEVKGQEGQLYVRKPGQDPVYVVKLDDKPLTTKFQDWIEEDLLQLSSIDIENVEIKDYNASLGLQGVSLSRNHVVELEKEGSTWTLASLKEYDKTNPLAEPKPVEGLEDKKLDSTKLNNLANALDDLKFVDVNRKPEGISANLKADQEFASDNEAAAELARRGFIPVPLGPNREIEILSANGEVTATTKGGVKYILRFGNISGISDQEQEEEGKDESAGGVNRYLMVSTEVDESKFPVPELKPIPQTLEDLEKLEKPKPPADVVLPPELNSEAEPAEMDGAENATESPADGEPKDAELATDGDGKVESDGSDEAESDSTSSDGATEESQSDSENQDTAEGEAEVSGEGESTTVGEGQEPAPQESEGEKSESQQSVTEEAESEEPEQASDEKADNSDSDNADTGNADTAKGAADQPATEEASSDTELTEEEKLEKLAAVQEKITKENERKLEERKEKLERAKVESQKLNQRFADWYYVIPEDTYSKLRISRDDLFDTSDGPAAPGPGAGFNPGAMPQFNFGPQGN